MTITRRRILAATAAAPLAAPWIGGTARAETKKLKISHQFPGGASRRRHGGLLVVFYPLLHPPGQRATRLAAAESPRPQTA